MKRTIEVSIKGMTCHSCEKIIKKSLEKEQGIFAANADFVLEKAIITFDPSKINEKKIRQIIDRAGYNCDDYCSPKKTGSAQEINIPDKLVYFSVALGIAVLLFGAYMLLKAFNIDFGFPQVSDNASYAILFGLGVLTGFHCIAMCGGFVLSYTAKSEGKSSMWSHVTYGAAKTISYTIIGAIFGLIGAAFTFTPAIRGIAAIVAGLFLLIFGLNMLGLLKSFRKVRLPQPKFVSELTGKNASPLIIGLLNGLFIACGPLQAMYIYAAGTGSMIKGATSLFFFGLGTLPVLLGFGIFASYISKSMTHKILKFSGVLVIVLALVMINRGLSLSGSGYDINTLVNANSINTNSNTNSVNGLSNNQIANPQSNNADAKQFVGYQTAELKDGYQIIRMDVTNDGWGPDKFVLQKGIPVKWIINGKELNSCNNAIIVSKYNLNFKIQQGEQTIEFTPTQSGIVPWSCWMGMIPGTFVVVDDLGSTNQQQVAAQVAAAPAKKSGSCSMGSGCGCAGMRR